MQSLSTFQLTRSQAQVAVPTVDTLSCVNAAQRRVANTLVRTGAGERLARLALSDVLETLLARAGDCIAASEEYRSQRYAHLRGPYLTLHLEMALATWLRDRASSRQELAATSKCLRTLQSSRP